MVSMGRFKEELWSRGRSHWRIKNNFSDTSYNRLQRLTTILQTLVTVLQTLTTVLQTLATVCGKINSQSVQNFFATRKTLCDNKNCLRTCLQPFTNPDETQNSLRSQAFAAQCDIPFIYPVYKVKAFQIT